MILVHDRVQWRFSIIRLELLGSTATVLVNYPPSYMGFNLDVVLKNGSTKLHSIACSDKLIDPLKLSGDYMYYLL